MSTCPEQDLHSAYFDNEVVSPWKEKMEAHIAACDSCKRRLASYENLHIAMHEDGHTLNELELVQSYTRLQAKIAREDSRTVPARGSVFTRKAVPALAAALIAAVVLPAGLYVNSTHKTQAAIASLTIPLEHRISADAVVVPDEGMKQAAFAAFGSQIPVRSADPNLKNVSFSQQGMCTPRFSSREETINISLPSVTEMSFMIDYAAAQIKENMAAAHP